MAQDIFLKINGIDGESQDASHKNEVEVLNWSWKIEQLSTMHSGSGGGAGKATVSDLTFEHHIDRASPNLMKYCLTGKHIDAEGLVACLSTGMARVARVTPDYVGSEAEVFSPAFVEFALAVTQVSHADVDGVPLFRADPSVVICTGGRVTVRTANGDSIELSRGESLHLGPDDTEPTVFGLGEVAQAFEPTARALRSRLIDVV